MGLILRSLYHTNDFKLYTEMLHLDDDKPVETKEQVIDKILRLLGDD